MQSEREQVGEFTAAVIETLSLTVEPGTPIYLGESNRRHMLRNHARDFQKYGNRIERIISLPDYVGLKLDGSIEFVKAFGIHIKVAVRVTASGEYYARTLYHVDGKLASNLISSGQWLPLKVLTDTQ